MLIVDTHCHAGHNWFEPVELLLHQMNTNGVDKAVLKQHRGTYDNTYLLECAQRYPGRFVVVAMVDHTQPDAPQTLEKWAAQGVIGVRLPPGARSPGHDEFAIWRKASELDLIVSSQGGLDGFASDEFNALVGQFPEMPIIVGHLTAVGQDARPPYAEVRKALTLANHPNTYLKVGGLGEISKRGDVLLPDFRFEDTPPLIEMAYDAFGPRRLMWGSDYPPVSGREGYRNALQGVMDYPAFAAGIDREWVMGKATAQLFGFG